MWQIPSGPATHSRQRSPPGSVSSQSRPVTLLQRKTAEGLLVPGVWALRPGPPHPQGFPVNLGRMSPAGSSRSWPGAGVVGDTSTLSSMVHLRTHLQRSPQGSLLPRGGQVLGTRGGPGAQQAWQLQEAPSLLGPGRGQFTHLLPSGGAETGRPSEQKLCPAREGCASVCPPRWATFWSSC